MARYVHTLSFPEHLWLEFFRVFFSQRSLVVDEHGFEVTNNFFFDENKPPENRSFDVLLEQDMTGANPNTLPSLVIEDLGTQSMNVVLNRLSDWSVFGSTSKTRTDLIRTTYAFHCTSRDRGESRLLASIVSNAITVFYDSLKKAGLHKIEPWSISKSVAVKATDSDEVYVATSVSVTFEYPQSWKTIESGSTDVFRSCIRFRDDELVAYVATVMNISYPESSVYVTSSMTVENVNASIYVMASAEVADAVATQRYVASSMTTADAELTQRYLRTSMRVS